MKIRFLINSLSTGGAENVLSVLANELVKENDVEIIFLEKNEFYELDNRIKKTYLSKFIGKEKGVKKFFYIFVFAWRLKNYIKQNNIKFIQSHLFRANYINVLAKLLGANHKAQLVTAGRISRYKELGTIGKINLFLISILYAKADLLILKSLGMKKDMQNLFNFRNKHVVIHNPCDINKIEKLSKEKINNFEFCKNNKYLISVGRLIKLKRHNEIIEILPRLDENIELIILGSGEEKERLESLSKNLGLEARVHFLGQVKNPYKYLAKSDIFVSCSESEGFPNVLVEAMVCKVPVISSDCLSGPREILGNNEFGLLFDVGNKKQLFNHINFLLANEDLKYEYIRKAKKRSYDFSLEKIIKKYKKVLHE